ncbi:MAG: pyruvate carboxylase [Acidobacteria bacterium]|nr:pyruvate carboxylase [Acidobacteriota bacterium]MCB9398037.1 pyruvate carboxylase [Acidobacteriota bacterium]
MSEEVRSIKRLLVANRGEIAIRVLRACNELGIESIAIYTHEDRYSLHRYKADEAYQIGADDDPLKPYLDIESILRLAKAKKVDAIHPGYGFLSENAEFAARCGEEGIIFVGPKVEILRGLGDKISAKKLAQKAQVPTVPTNEQAVTSAEIARVEAERMGFPVIIKASAGGGGRGMRVVRKAEEMDSAFEAAQREAGTAFGNDTVFLEKFLENPKHIEVQLLGDEHGNLVHLFERDCSVQRRFQKLVEVAPAKGLASEVRAKLFEYALAIGRSVAYNNAGTVEFLVENDQVYFIEVNPRIQVEHTVTEEVTGVDIVRSQILIAKGHKLSDTCIYLRNQDDVQCNGFALQCRITTEDPENNFQPDYGTIIAYRHAGGFGIRIDEGSTYPGMRISPFFDSLLVKVTASGRTLWGASERLERALREFRVRGVKTNGLFLLNVIQHPVFLEGKAGVRFIADHPELFILPKRMDRATKILRFLSHVSINGHPDFAKQETVPSFLPLRLPGNDEGEIPAGTKQKLATLGPEKFAAWLRAESGIHFTDTTFRDAHQSLLATRVRTLDLVRVASLFAQQHPQTFSMEVWGGATFDVAMRFLHECPWDRLRQLRSAIPNILLQMLLRSSNAVGYSAYPDNVVAAFIEKAAENGIDLFRIFDSLNWIENLKVSIRMVRERTNALAEGCICYTGDLQNPKRKKYNLTYYLDLARQIEDAGAHILAIKDMAGLLKPYAAQELIQALRETVAIPIHLHTHDTSAIQAATYLKAIDAGVDVIDVALASMSGLTSQPNFNSIVAMLMGHPRERRFDMHSLNRHSDYWEDVRTRYFPFESGLKAGTAEVYEHEIPGGQYSNLRPQARALGLEDRFDLIKKNYTAVNHLFGDLVKVTPSSKVVGDMAMYLTANGISIEELENQSREISFPGSVKQFFRGELGQPFGGFPEALQKQVLGKEEPYVGRANEHLKPIDLETAFPEFQKKFPDLASFEDFLSHTLYPKVFEDYYQHRVQYGQVAKIPTEAYFFGLRPGQELMVEMAPGKLILVQMVHLGPADAEGMRSVQYALNGQMRSVRVRDYAVQPSKAVHRKAEKAGEIGAPLQGKLGKIFVEVGQTIQPGQALFSVEAMKMESTVQASAGGVVQELVLTAGDLLHQDDLVLVLKL